MTKPEPGEINYRACPNCGNEQFTIKFVEEQFRVVRCVKCRLVYLANPPSDKAVYEKYFENVQYKTVDYCENSSSEPLSRLFEINKKRVELIKNEKPSGRLLDVGCGRGFFMKSAFDAGYDLYGTDISKQAVLFARDSFDLNAEAISLDELQAMGEKFDIITLWHVLEHFLNPRDELSKIMNLLKNDGLCFIEVPNLRSLKFILSRRKWIGGNHPRYHRAFFTRFTLERMVKKSGFADMKRLSSGYPDQKRGRLYHKTKSLLDRVALDSFLTYVARK